MIELQKPCLRPICFAEEFQKQVASKSSQEIKLMDSEELKNNWQKPI
jgi:hypothetical protein